MPLLGPAAADRVTPRLPRAPQTGQLVVNRAAAAPLARVFRKLYALHFPIRHMRLDDVYGPRRDRPRDGDVSGSFECRRGGPVAVHGRARHRLLVDARLRAGGRSQPGREPLRRMRPEPRPRRRSVPRPLAAPARDGHPRVIEAFRSIGWGWGGAWTGNTKDYMHFSSTGH